MTISALLADLQARDIVIDVQGERLRIDAPQGALSPEIRAVLAARKPEILAYLSSRAAANEPTEPGERALSPSERRMWILDRIAGDEPTYNILSGIRMRGRLDEDALRRSLDQIARRHDVLRTVYVERDGEPRAIVQPHQGLAVEAVDLRSRPADVREDELRRVAEQWGRVRFHLDQGPLFRPLLVRLTDDDTALLLAQHHIVSDGWSQGVFARELGILYAALSTGQASPLPALAGSYGRIVEEHGRWQTSAESAEQRAYWKARLADLPPLELRGDRAPVAERTRRGGSHRFAIDPALAKALTALAARERTTPYALLLSAYATLLHRYTGQVDFGIGTVVANRTGAMARELVGCFVNTLVVRVEPASAQRFTDLLAATRTRVLEAFDRQALPFDEVVREVGERRAGGMNPLIEACFVLENLPMPSAAVAGLSFAPLLLTPDGAIEGTAKFDLGLILSEIEGQLGGAFEYAADLFAPDTVAHLAGHFTRLLESIVREPDVHVGTLALQSDEERARSVVGWNDTAADYDRDVCLHQIFEAQVDRTPDAPAVHAGDRTLTYAEVDARANALARALRDRGVGPSDRVAVVLDRCPEMIVALLAILKAGGAYVPVDPGYPEDRIQFLLADSRAVVVLSRAAIATARGLDAATLILVDDPLPPSTERLVGAATSRDLAYVIYTSGSTGRPKGVMVEHHAVVNRIAWMQKRYPIGAADVLLQKTPISFDVSVWELFWWQLVGARLVLLPVGGEKDPAELLGAIATRGVTTLHFVPSMLGPFLDALEALETADAQAAIASLRFVFCSGEALPPNLVNRFHAIVGTAGRRPLLVNLYGPTEATVDVSYFDCPPDQVIDRVPIGRPIDNTQLYIVNAEREPQPVGVAGELCIAGVGLARGYLERPELTAEKFVDNPFQPGTRMYRTGDLARWLDDGNIEYLGRIDDQVKIRGNRIELGEVQHCLASAPGVRQALVVDRESAERGRHLCGYYVADHEIEAERLRAHILASLPEFMVPAYFVRLDQVPLTPNGKADRRALPAPVATSSGVRTAPRNPTEALLVSIWSETLGVDVGVDDDFFVLGGDSMSMIKVSAAAQRRGLSLSFRDALEHRTIASLAAHVQTADPQVATGPTAPFALVPVVDRPLLASLDLDDAFPVTSLQLAMLYHSRERERSAVYHDVFHYQLRLAWNEDAFRGAVAALIQRHPALRSSFDLASYSEALQLVHREVHGALSILDLRALPDPDADRVIRAHIDERRLHRYTFDAAPLYRFAVHLRRDRVEIVLSFHHAILDGWSVASLMRELIQDTLHRSGAAVAAVEPPVLTSPAEYVAEELRASASERSQAFWREQLDGAELLRLDGFRAHEPVVADHGAPIQRTAALSEPLEAAIARLSRAHAIPVKSILFAAHGMTLRLFSGQDDVTTGLVTHGRPERDGAERLAGLFLQTLPIRIRGDASTWLAAATEAFRQERATYPHRRYPLAFMQRDRGGAPILDTAFNYVHFHVLAALAQSTDVELLGFAAHEETNFKVLVNAIRDPRDSRTSLTFQFDGRVFSAGQADLFVRTFVAILERLADHPAEPVDFGFLVKSRHNPDPHSPNPQNPSSHNPNPLILSESRAPARDESKDGRLREEDRPSTRSKTRSLRASGGDVSRDDDVIALFDEQVARQPDAVAVVDDGAHRWTYAELDRAAADVTGRLIAAGVSAGARVGIAMDRSLEMIAAVVGVLRAGATCVPLDVSYPPARIAMMLEQAGPARVLVHPRHAAIAPASLALVIEPGSLTGAAPVPRSLPLAPESLAYILFTSGSTGRPKGVAMPHRALANLVRWQNARPSGAVGGRTLQNAPLSFDVSFQEIFATLAGGGSLQLVSDDQRRDVPSLLRLLEREGVERVFLPYVALQQLAEAADALGLYPARLRVIASSGEQLRVTPEIRRFCARLPGCLLENQYGPTETHVVTTYTMTGDPASWPALPPIGAPIDGATVEVLDRSMRPVPAGVDGEIWIGGVCLADGYDGQPALTAERFVTAAGVTRYRSGDLGRVLPSGDIVCLGRADAQIKVRGFRVEPAEVELAILAAAHDMDLGEIAVVGRRRGDSDSFLAAFLVPGDTAVDLALLKERLRAALPEHMVPAHVQVLDALPRTPSGKRDDAALRARPLALATRATTSTPPRDAVEQQLADIVAGLLDVPSVGIHDDFFELGGTSLTAMRLVVTIEKRYGLSVPLSAFVAGRTVADLAERVRARRAPTAYDPLVPMRRNQGARRPLFFVHPIGGNVLCYVPLARHLPDDRPFFGLAAPGVEPGTTAVSSLDELARTYIAAMRRVQPSGPYAVGGWSFGGLVAFEIARQLLAAGEAVEHLILLDTIVPAAGQTPEVDSDQLLQWFFWELLSAQLGARASEETLAGDLATLDEKFDFILRRAIAAGVLPTGSSSALVRRLYQVFEANWRALLAFRPVAIDQPMTLLRASGALPESLERAHRTSGTQYLDPSNGWSELTTAGLEIIDVPGDHLRMMEEPNVQVVASEVRRILDRPRSPQTRGRTMKTSQRARAIVIGAGIGGLTTAIALRRAGVDVEIYERARKLETAGTALGILSNAVAALRSIGIEGALEQRGQVVNSFEHRSPDGKTVLARTPLGEISAKLGAPSVAIHRAELQQALLEAVGDCPIHLGARCAGFETDDDDGPVRVQFEDGREVEGDILIGADGFHSAVRRHLVGPETPREPGYVCWLATVPFAHPGMPTGFVGHYLGRGARFGLLDIGHGNAYWFGAKNVGAEAARAGRVSKAEIAECFAGWADEVQAAIEVTPEASIVSVAAMDRRPLKRWVRGRVALLGDAAHPMLTSLSQGAGMAIEDAIVLAECLRGVTGETDLALALATYEQRRKPRAHRMVRLSRMLSTLELLENPIATSVRTAYLRLTPARVWARQYESVLTFETAGL